MTEHLLNGKPLSECTCDELAKAASDGEAYAALGEGWSDEQDARLRALHVAFDAKPETEKVAFQEYWEPHP